MSDEYDVLIVGGGVSGTSLLYVLSRFSNITNIALIEKCAKLGQINSNTNNNSQTLHFGDIETNYTVEKAAKVKHKADLVKNYVENEKKNGSKTKIFSKYNKMVLAVGSEQVEKLDKRYNEFKELFPLLKKIDKKEISMLEPKVVKGRDKNQKLLALSSPNGYAIDFAALSESFVKNAIKENNDIKISLGEKLLSIKKSNIYQVYTNKRIILAKTVVIACGGHSLLYAHSLEYGKEFSILSIAGNFYLGSHTLNGKVYTMQQKKLPFAAIHGDPDVHNQKEIRFGPTAKAIPLLERHNYSSFWQYLKTFGFGIKPWFTLIKVLSDPIIFKYILRNFAYDIPIIGKRLFIKEVRKIVPLIKLNELKFAKGYGGTRPQIINTKTKSLDMGEAKILGDNIIFNITPSPGASTCLGNAEEDAKHIVKFLGSGFKFDKKTFNEELA